MRVIPGPDGWPEAIEYRPAGARSALRRSRPPCARSCMCALFHPLNDHYGMSPIEAAAARDRHPQRGRLWNKALLDNAARPSGALVYAARGGNLTDEQFDRLKRELEESFSGREQCRPADAARRRARLEADVAVAEGHGFRRGQERCGARDRAGAGRAADAARHSRRQHVLELSGGTARILARHGAAADCAHDQSILGLARAGLRRAT